MPPSREQLQQQIQAIDARINEVVGSVRIAESATKPHGLPIFTLVLAAAAWGFANFGDQIPGAGDFHKTYGYYGMYVCYALLAFAALGFFQYFTQRRTTVDKDYMEKTAEARELQEERKILQKQLKALDAE